MERLAVPQVASIRLSTLQYLVDRRDGKARQAVELSGALLQAHVAYRDPVLAGLSAEELAMLDAITRKLALPAATPDASQDGPQNQIESKPALLPAGVEENHDLTGISDRVKTNPRLLT